MSQQDLLSARDVDELLPWSLIRAARKAAHLVSEALLEFELTPVEFGILTYLEVTGSATQAELARMISVRPQSIAPTSRALIERGLVAHPGAGGRGRPARLALTPAGEALLAQVFPVVSTLNKRFPGTAAGRENANAFLLSFIAS